MDEDSETVTREALQQTLAQLVQVLDGLKDLKAAVDREMNVPDPRPDAKIIPFPSSRRQN